MKVILSHSGKQHSYHVAKALKNVGALKRFYTSSYVSNPIIQSAVTGLGIDYLQRRFLQGLSGSDVSTKWRYEFAEIALRMRKVSSARVNTAVFNRDQAFDRDLSKKLKRLDFDTFWGFQGSSLECLREANTLGKKSVCEMTIAHLPFAKKVLEDEARMHPEWAESIDFSSFPPSYEERLIEEPISAGYVIAISEFLKNTLTSSGIDPKKIQVVPLGFEPQVIRFDSEPKSISNRPLRVLFAGRVTQRKGMSYLLEAFSKLNKRDVELHIIGNIHGNGEMFKKFNSIYHYTPGVSQHTLFNIYTDYDLLVFPSLLEGFGLVTIEAMGAGLPVITTANTNAFELIKDGINGQLIPIRDSNAIYNSLVKIRNMSDIEFQAMRIAARNTALEYTWDAYEVKVRHFIEKIR